MVKKNYTTAVLVSLLLLGLGLMLYPSLSDYYNSFHQTRAITNYETALTKIDSEEYTEMLEKAAEYNEEFARSGQLFTPTGDRLAAYEELLNPEGNGMMGYIEIPSIRVKLSLYHGTDDSALGFAAEHIMWSSLPVGGENTHAIISGHRGLPSAKLFSDLDMLREGDIFKLSILNETLTYEVDQIRVVLPEEATQLTLIPGGDFCTLVTCTPYGINTHRMLVRGHRIATAETAHVISEAAQVEKTIVAAVIAVPTFLLMVLYVMIRYGRKGKHEDIDEIKRLFKGSGDNNESNV